MVAHDIAYLLCHLTSSTPAMFALNPSVDSSALAALEAAEDVEVEVGKVRWKGRMWLLHQFVWVSMQNVWDWLTQVWGGFTLLLRDKLDQLAWKRFPYRPLDNSTVDCSFLDIVLRQSQVSVWWDNDDEASCFRKPSVICFLNFTIIAGLISYHVCVFINNLQYISMWQHTLCMDGYCYWILLRKCCTEGIHVSQWWPYLRLFSH